MKNKFKKIVLVVVGTASSIGSYMFSGAGIVAGALGSLTAATVFAVEKKKTSKPINTNKQVHIKKEEKRTEEKSKTEHRKELRKKIITKKSSLKNHRCELKKLKRAGKGATPEAQKHTTIIEYLENDIQNIKRDLRDL